MNEDFLHYLWKYRLYESDQLETVHKEGLQVLGTGVPNYDAGPDFFNARIKLGNTIWAGNVEIHKSSSDWLAHKHQHDPAYDNVILHVVFENDVEILRKDKSPIPVLELKGRFKSNLLNNYNQLLNGQKWIPCQDRIGWVDSFVVNNWLDRLMVERLESKSESILNSLMLNKNSWEESFYQAMARTFGGKVNADPFELLARLIPLNTLAKVRDDCFKIEAILFGQAGLLNKKHLDPYALRLKKEYEFQQRKLALKPMEGHLWKFSRLRPANFPTIRISQFAALIHRSSKLFSKIMEAKDLNELRDFFVIGASEYWNTHYTFDGNSSPSRRT